jgi:hypothetical protein
MAHLFVKFGSSMILLTAVMLGGCDKVAGVAADGANNLGSAISPVAKAIIGPSDARLNAQTICMNETAARYPGRNLTMIDSSIEGSNKFSVLINFKRTPEEFDALQRNNSGESPLMMSIIANMPQSISCDTDNGVITRFE